MQSLPVRALMIDLDGTLADTALDLVAAVEHVCATYGVPPPPYAVLRAQVSGGGATLLRAGLGFDRTHPEFARAHRRFLSFYAHHPAERTRLFDGMDELLAQADKRHIRWCVVTNKPEPLARLVMHGLGLSKRGCGLIATGTTARNKPDAQPVRMAAHLTGIAPQQMLMVGDDRRDVQSASAAGATSIAAAWGYLAPGDEPHSWGAHGVAGHAREVLDWLP